MKLFNSFTCYGKLQHISIMGYIFLRDEEREGEGEWGGRERES